MLSGQINKPKKILSPIIKKVAFLYTDLQKKIFISINQDNLKDFVVLYPASRKEIAEKDFISVNSTDQKLNYKKSKALITEIHNILSNKLGGCSYELWLASCDNPTGQVLINHPGRKKIVLFEDGIGSYVKHPFLDIGKGWRNVARKMKYILLLFPHYRSYYGIGSQKADEYWSLHKGAFPHSKRDTKQINTDDLRDSFAMSKSEFVSPEKSIIYLDQPLTRNKIISHSELERLIKIHIDKLNYKYNPDIYFIKPHPVSTPAETAETIKIFTQYTDAKIMTIQEKNSIESITLSPNFKALEIFSFISSALYTIKAINPHLTVSSISTLKALKENPLLVDYINAMNTIGIKTHTYK